MTITKRVFAMTSGCNLLPDSPTGERVLVIGGRGFVGSHIVRTLVRAGIRPQLFGPPMMEDRLADIVGHFDEHEGSIESAEGLRQAFRKSGAQSVISCAAHGVGRLGLMQSGEAEADAAMAINVMGLHKLMSCASEANVRRVVWMSSTVVYGPSSAYPVQPVDEDERPAPRTFYGLTKTMAEEVATFYSRRHDLSVVGLRLPLILGPGLWYEGAAAKLAQMFDAARTGAPYCLRFHNESVDLMHVSDVAAAVMAVLWYPGHLDPTYNLEGFKARASELVAELVRQEPEASITFKSLPATMLFPLISGTRLREATGFVAPHNLNAFTTAMLAKDTAHG